MSSMSMAPLSVIVACVAVTTEPVLAQDWVEIGDAPEFPGACAQIVTGSGPLLTISGTTNTGLDDFVDAYVIDITDAASFYATTSPAWDADAVCVWDTRLFLFDPNGLPLLANDDAPGGVGAQSYLSGPALYSGDVDPTAQPLTNGTHILVISGWANDPIDVASVALFALGSDFDALFGPDPAAGDFDRWENFHGLVQSGPYTIALAGASMIPGIASCPEDLNCDAVVNVFDLLILLGNFGNTPPEDTTGDVTGPSPGDPPDGIVDVFDLLAVLGLFGQACPAP